MTVPVDQVAGTTSSARRCAGFVSALLVGGCGPMTVEDQIGATKVACFMKAGDLFADVQRAARALDADVSRDAGNEDTSDTIFPGESFRFVTTGKFIYDVPASGAGGMAALSCTGDFNRKTIETIDYHGLEKRPATGEVWSI